MESPNLTDLTETAVFGRMVEDFVKSEIGSYITQGMKELRSESLEKLAEIDFSDANGILRLQERIKVCHVFNDLLVEAVQRGRNALEILEDEHGN